MSNQDSNLPNFIFATGNANKVKEVAKILEGKIVLKSLKDIGFTEDIPEDHPTLEANAIQKAQYIYDRYGLNCFAEDTGMEVEAINGEPGVYSARYAGPEKDTEKNMDLVLEKLGDNTNRAAQFRTVVALILDGKVHTFEGIVKGNISMARLGDQGFGYDPIFVPEGLETSFAQMSSEDKNAISHRGRAIQKLTDFLSTI